MYEATVILFNCGSLKARLSKEACVDTHKKKRGLKFNNDPEGLPFSYERCSNCLGVAGPGEKVMVTASPPRPPRVAVLTIDGGYGYVR